MPSKYKELSGLAREKAWKGHLNKAVTKHYNAHGEGLVYYFLSELGNGGTKILRVPKFYPLVVMNCQDLQTCLASDAGCKRCSPLLRTAKVLFIALMLPKNMAHKHQTSIDLPA